MFRIEMTQKELDEIQSQLNEFSTPVDRCWVCNIPVYAQAENEKPICLECLVLQHEYRRLSHGEQTDTASIKPKEKD